MQDEQHEIADFLGRHLPFSALAPETVRRIALRMDVRYCKAGTRIVEAGQEAVAWHVVRSGAVEVFRRDGTLYNRLTEGGHFGEFGLLHRRRVRFPVAALEDTLLYLLPADDFLELFDSDETFADLVETEDRTRLRQAVSRSEDTSALMSATVESLLTRTLVSVHGEASVRAAAQRMTEHGVSSLLILDTAAPPDSTQDTSDAPEALVGILTDRDLRTRVLAQGLDQETPVREVMTPGPVCVQTRQMVFEAMLQMLRHNVHHLPVLRGRQPVGVIAISDVIRYESRHSLFLVGSIFRQRSVDELASLVPEVQASFTHMVEAGGSARVVGSAMAVIGRSFKQRLLELGEAQLGPPPVPYCFLALGSMARHEQLLVTDQDNAMILDNRYDPAHHADYFRTLAEFVCEGLARCGYPLCSGDIMATNPRWRQPLGLWEQTFSQWIAQPTPETLLRSSIFFDLDGVWGQVHWAERLRRQVAQQARGNSVFLACMARNALLRTPPLGFFKDFVVESDGRHSDTINLKRRGTAPLVDLIRVHALAAGSTALGSHERLRDVMKAGLLPPGRGPDLQDALAFISSVRMRTQAADLKEGAAPGNSVQPDKLSDFERKSLRDAFQILSQAQGYLKYRYQPGRST